MRPAQEDAPLRFYRHTAIILSALSVLAGVMLFFGPPAGAQEMRTISGVYFAGVFYDDRICVTQFRELSTDVEKIALAGLTITPEAKNAAHRYIDAFLGNMPVNIDLYLTKDQTGYVGVFKSLRDDKSYELNKNLVYLGYATASGDPRFSEYKTLEAKAKERQVGIWSPQKSVWIMPKFVEKKLPRLPFSSDRNEIHAQYGRPDSTFTMTTGGRGYAGEYYMGNIYVYDYYYRKGIVFIYRNGKLLEKKASY